MDYIGLFKALTLLKGEEEVEYFFKDLCTSKEIDELQNRWKVCELLSSTNLSYREIKEQTHVSLTTICRVARFLVNESHGEYLKIHQRNSKDGENV